MDNHQHKIIQSSTVLFNNSYLDAKALYTYLFSTIPCISWIRAINVAKAIAHIESKFCGRIKNTYQYSQFNHTNRKNEWSTTIMELDGNMMIELGSDYVEILHCYADTAAANMLIGELSAHKVKAKKVPFEINLIVRDSYGLELKGLEIKKTNLDLGLYYDDSFLEVDAVIQKRLNTKNDKGIVLLHGLPGTGKTTYLRYLIGKMKKKVMFLSPNVASSLVDPEFMNILIDNPNSILVIEDAENIIMDRKSNSDSSVSNLLNISDGLLADFLNVQLICTFNNSLTMVDSALMRKGRLIAKYEFGKLPTHKAQRLSNHLGNNSTVNKPMTIAEIANQHEKEQDLKPMQVMGFRREAIEN